MMRCECGSYNVLDEYIGRCLACAGRAIVSGGKRSLLHFIWSERDDSDPITHADNGYRKRTREEKLAEYASYYGGEYVVPEIEWLPVNPESLSILATTHDHIQFECRATPEELARANAVLGAMVGARFEDLGPIPMHVQDHRSCYDDEDYQTRAYLALLNKPNAE